MTYEQWLAALCIWREARGASIQAMHAIWWVIQNRANDPAKRWPRTIAGVILQPAQFSSFSRGDNNSVKFPAPPIDGAAPSPDWSAFLNCQIAVSTDLGGDPTGGATNYESEPIEARPAWADPDKLTATIGPFRFYKL